MFMYHDPHGYAPHGRALDERVVGPGERREQRENVPEVDALQREQ